VIEAAARDAEPRPRPRRRGGRHESVYAYLTLLPVLLILAAFTVYPVANAVYLSLHKELLTQPASHPFVGLANYRNVFGSGYLADAIVATAVFDLSAVPSVLVFGILGGLLMNQRFPGAAVLRVAIVLPWALSPVVSGIMWRWIFNGDYGVVDSILYQVGLTHQYVPWLSNTALARAALTVAQLWHEGPLAAIFVLAGLQAIPRDIYGAGAVDGAGPWRAFRHLTLPLLKPTLLIVLIYETIVATVTFDLVYIMTGGGPANATALISWFAYEEVFKFLDLGGGAALAFLIALALLAVIAAYLRVLRLGYRAS
jgi:multiple sugar transport system permease protein